MISQNSSTCRFSDLFSYVATHDLCYVFLRFFVSILGTKAKLIRLSLVATFSIFKYLLNTNPEKT
ncbi:hypothetical protein BpHYR1_008757 [Brachionus plicatilis]|uniref:Uncharacterized protein n=1 Tax=Brachionus plicatilis TaxID=10195 RepID=A0A3M7PDR7_BRAPC|nr:hypothetical protein BpHYR1_008757 [Brachionus plicatilis]